MGWCSDTSTSTFSETASLDSFSCWLVSYGSSSLTSSLATLDSSVVLASSLSSFSCSYYCTVSPSCFVFSSTKAEGVSSWWSSLFGSSSETSFFSSVSADAEESSSFYWTSGKSAVALSWALLPESSPPSVIVGVGALFVFLIAAASGPSKKRSSKALISQLKISFARKGNLMKRLRQIWSYLWPRLWEALSGGMTVIRSTRSFIFSWSKLWPSKNDGKILLLDQFIIEILKLLQTIVVLQELFNRAVFLVQDVLNRSATLVAVAAPESAIQKSIYRVIIAKWARTLQSSALIFLIKDSNLD